MRSYIIFPAISSCFIDSKIASFIFGFILKSVSRFYFWSLWFPSKAPVPLVDLLLGQANILKLSFPWKPRVAERVGHVTSAQEAQEMANFRAISNLSFLSRSNWASSGEPNTSSSDEIRLIPEGSIRRHLPPVPLDRDRTSAHSLRCCGQNEGDHTSIARSIRGIRLYGPLRFFCEDWSSRWGCRVAAKCTLWIYDDTFSC